MLRASALNVLARSHISSMLVCYDYFISKGKRKNRYSFPQATISLKFHECTHCIRLTVYSFFFLSPFTFLVAYFSLKISSFHNVTNSLWLNEILHEALHTKTEYFTWSVEASQTFSQICKCVFQARYFPIDLMNRS